MASAESLRHTFHVKYIEFCNDLLQAIPEMNEVIMSARVLSEELRLKRFIEEVLTNCSPSRDASACHPPYSSTDDPGASYQQTSRDDLRKCRPF